VILKGRETRDDLPAHTEGRNPVRDHLIGVRNDLENRPAQRLKRAALRLVDTPQYSSTSSADMRSSLKGFDSRDERNPLSPPTRKE